MIPCPHCGSIHTRHGTEGRTTGRVVGGMAGAAFVVLRIIGLAWGGQAGYAIGAKIDQTFPRSRCCACGKDFVL